MKIAALCGMGFGSSMMLKLSIEDILKEEGIEAEVLSWDLGSVKGQEVDIIVAPQDMKSNLESVEANIVLLKNLTDNEEIKEKVLKAIEEVS